MYAKYTRSMIVFPMWFSLATFLCGIDDTPQSAATLHTVTLPVWYGERKITTQVCT